MGKGRCNMSYEEEEYQRVLDKHGKRVKRQNKNKDEHLEENLKAKNAMRLFRGNTEEEKRNVFQDTGRTLQKKKIGRIFLS